MGRASGYADRQGSLMAEPSAQAPPDLDRATSLLAEGRQNEALEAASRALAARDSADARALFVRCVRGADQLPAFPGFRRLLIRALRETWARPAVLTGAALAA